MVDFVSFLVCIYEVAGVHRNIEVFSSMGSCFWGVPIVPRGVRSVGVL